MTVKHQCELLGLARSTAYYEPKALVISEEEIYIKNEIDRVHSENPLMGFEEYE